LRRHNEGAAAPFLFLLCASAALFLAAESCHEAWASKSDPSKEMRQETGKWDVVKGSPKSCKAGARKIQCASKTGEDHWVLSRDVLQGNWALEARFEVGEPASSGILFEVQDDLKYGYLLTLDPDLTLWRIKDGQIDSKSRELMNLHAKVLAMAHHEDQAADEKSKLAAAIENHKGFQTLRIVKTGGTYAFWENGLLVTTISNPRQDSTEWKSEHEPEAGRYGFAMTGQGVSKVMPLAVHPLQLAVKDANNPILKPGPSGSWDDAIIFTGSVMKEGDTYYLYFTGRDTHSKKDGGAVGVATSKDLEYWTENPHNPILPDDSVKGIWDYTLQAGSVVRAPDGRYALFYDGSDGDNWRGIGVAFSDSPLGPFHRYEGNPVLTRGNSGEFDSHAMHLHTARRQEDGTYLLFYTGYPSDASKGRKGDRGGLATSRDLIHWEKYAGNPVFDLGPLGAWDDTHVRPKTLVKRGDWYYMFYEGTNNDGVFWWDQVGMARSPDLIHWQRFPFNPIIPLGTSGAYDSAVTEWPAAFIERTDFNVFYMCGPMIQMRLMICKSKLPESVLQSWDVK